MAFPSMLYITFVIGRYMSIPKDVMFSSFPTVVCGRGRGGEDGFRDEAVIGEHRLLAYIRPGHQYIRHFIWMWLHGAIRFAQSVEAAPHLHNGAVGGPPRQLLPDLLEAHS